MVTGTLSLSASVATMKRLLFRSPLGCAPSLGSARAARPPGSCSLCEARSRHVGAELVNGEGGRALTPLYLLYSPPSSISTLSCDCTQISSRPTQSYRVSFLVHRRVSSSVIYAWCLHFLPVCVVFYTAASAPAENVLIAASVLVAKPTRGIFRLSNLSITHLMMLDIIIYFL